MDAQEREDLLKELLDRFKRGELSRRDLLKAASTLGMAAVAFKLLSAAETGSLSGPAAQAASLKKGQYQVDPVTAALMKQARRLRVETVWDRFRRKERHSKKEPLYATCINCQQGPCRKVGPQERGTCGMDVSGIVSRNLLRETAAGTSAHLGQTRRVATILKRVGEGTLSSAYAIKDPQKLADIYARLGLSGAASAADMARELGEATLHDLTTLEEPPRWLTGTALDERQNTWASLGLMPVGGAPEVQEAMHMATIGVNGSYAELILRCARQGLIDGYCGLHASSGIQDVLFGTPGIIMARSNLSVIDPHRINIAVHGHVPLLAEKVVDWAGIRQSEGGLPAGAQGINVVGFCCTGNEVLMRRGIGIAGDYLQQELALCTGALEVMVVDVQCVMPVLASETIPHKIPGVEQCDATCHRGKHALFHTEIITTDPLGKQRGATHLEIDPLDPNLTDADVDRVAKEIVDRAIANFANRDPALVFVPNEPPAELMAGFSTEQIVAALSAVDSVDPLGVLVGQIAEGNIRGIAAVIGCVTPRDTYGYRVVELIRELIAHDVLVVVTGCAAIVAAHHGLLKPDPAYPGVGAGLRAVLEVLAGANGLEALPPCLHMGS